MKEKTTLCREVVCFKILDFETSSSNSEVSKLNSWKFNSFSKTTLLGAVSYNVLYYQQLPITGYQIICYAYNYFE